MPKPTDPKWTGIRRKGAGWQVTVSRGHGASRLFKQFPLETPVAVMAAWRQDQLAGLRLTRRQRLTQGMFEADAKRYLQAVRSMPTYADREREIHRWIAVFGRVSRGDITAADIRAVREQWLTERRSPADKRPLAPGTVNKRLRALSNLWTVLDGRRAPNPVREVPEAEEVTGPPRALDYALIERILQAMPDRGRRLKGQKAAPVSHAKARLRVMAYTGWPPATLKALTSADVDLERHTATLPARRKGKGAPAVTVPLVPRAVEALKTFATLKLWGPFDQRAVNRSWKRAAKRCGVPQVRCYDLRHSFLTAVGHTSRDERAVQAMAQHRDIRTTRRYTEGSVDARVASAVHAAAAHFAGSDGGGHTES